MKRFKPEAPDKDGWGNKYMMKDQCQRPVNSEEKNTYDT